MKQRPRTPRGLALWLASTSTPLFVLDAHRKVLFFNRGCEQLTGWKAGDVIGQVCDYVSEPDPAQIEALTGALPPTRMEPRRVCRWSQRSVAHRNGERAAQQVLYIPLPGDEGQAGQTLGVIRPLPEPTIAPTTTPGQSLHAELAALRGALRRRYEVSGLVGCTAAFRRLLHQLQLGQASLASVHLRGETGTGKEHLARVMHYQSDRRLTTFVPLDCRTTPVRELKHTLSRVLQDSAEPEASRLLPGTIYLQQVDTLHPEVQSLLVEAFAGERHRGRPVLRLISSSTRSLDEAVAQESMSEACFYLLTELTIEVPALRERMDDLPLLAQHLLESLNRDQESQVGGFSEDVWQQFRQYNWPGNLDELQAVIREARAHCTRPLIGVADLPFRFRTGWQAQSERPPQRAAVRPLAETLDAVEREQILQALQLAQQNKSKAAEWLGLTRPKLYRRMQSLGLVAEDPTEGQSQ